MNRKAISSYLLVTALFISGIINSIFAQDGIESILPEGNNPSDTLIKGKTDSTKVSFVPNENPEVFPYRIETNNITIDGEPNEKIWNSGKLLTNFSEVEPGNNSKPEVDTEARILYDEDYLYISFICKDKNIKKIRKTLTQRDNIFNDDFVGIMIDTYSEGKNAYEMFVNAYGIQGDLLWSSDGNEDANFDAIWYSAAEVKSDRWTAEIKIPFKSIRFPDKDIQNWNFHIIRTRPRNNRYQYSYVKIDRNSPTTFTSHGVLKDLKNIKGGNNFEILPYVLSSQASYLSDGYNAQSDFINEKIKGRVGLNLKYGITSNLTADFALNPDFSQVESDAGTISVNRTFALFYNEKRPFFNEGTNIFNTYLTTVYTRSINDPLYAVKLTGKIGLNEVGFISAYDRQTPFIIPFSEFSDFLSTDRKSLSNIFRFKRSILGNESFIGLIFTDRQVNKEGDSKFLDVDGYNRVAGIDGNFKFLDNYYFQFQFLRSFTREITDTNYNNEIVFGDEDLTGKLDGQYLAGNGLYMTFRRSAESWNFRFTYEDASPNMRRDNGFIFNNNYRTFSTSQGYLFYPKSDILLRIEPSVYALARYDYDFKPMEYFLSPSVWMRLINQISIFTRYFIVNNEVFRGKYHQDVRRGYLEISSSFSDNIRGGASVEAGRYIIRDNNSRIGYGTEVYLWGTIKPVNSLSISFNYDYFELAESYRGEKLFAGYILRNTNNFMFTKDISLRLINEYNSFDGSLYINPLLSYRPNPFTIFYLGMTHSYMELDDINYKAKSTLTDRQFFLKMQYLFRI